jgi:hypothetical protein
MAVTLDVGEATTRRWMCEYGIIRSQNRVIVEGQELGNLLVTRPLLVIEPKRGNSLCRPAPVG